jgi:uncharacterized protein YegP (UPF0339 family)
MTPQEQGHESHGAQVEPFRFQIRKGHDGRHRWYLYNASGSIVGSNTAGFASELEACQDVEHVRAELASAPIVGEVGEAVLARA